MEQMLLEFPVCYGRLDVSKWGVECKHLTKLILCPDSLASGGRWGMLKAPKHQQILQGLRCIVSCYRLSSQDRFTDTFTMATFQIFYHLGREQKEVWEP